MHSSCDPLGTRYVSGVARLSVSSDLEKPLRIRPGRPGRLGDFFFPRRPEGGRTHFEVAAAA